MKGDIFHLLNRGVEKRKVFLNEKDFLRFIYNLDDFNDTENVTLPYLSRRRRREKLDVARPKEELVDNLCWALLPNHPHVLIQEKIDGGISIYSKKTIGGYTKYFNEVYKREGVLFQGRSKIIKVTREPHLFHLPFYIMANPIDLIEPQWREKGIKNLSKVIKFLENYRYSSFLDLIGKENFPSIFNKKLFYQIFDTNEKKFKEGFIEWLKAHSYQKFAFKKFE